MKFMSHNPVKCRCEQKSGRVVFCKKHRCYVKDGKRDRK